MTSRRSATLVRPAWRSVPPPASSTGPEAIELAASAGLVLDPWQCEAVKDLLGEDAGGKWAATSGGLVCPRQNGKGSVIEALELAWLFLCDVELIFHSAHLFATSLDAFRRIRSLIQTTPDLDRQVRRYSSQHGMEGIELRSGQRLQFVARSKSGGRGFPAPVVVLDEAFNLSQQAMQALVPTMAAQPNPFLLVTSSAPIDDPCSNVLRTFMSRSRSGEVDRRCYIEYCARPGDPLDKQIEDANPGYGVRLNDDVIAEERELLSPEAFEIERLGIVELDSAALTGVIGSDDWFACLEEDHQAGRTVIYALDVSPSGRSAAIAASDGTHVEVVKYASGTSWVVDACVAKQRVLGTLYIDPASPAGALIAPLKSRGIDVYEVTAREHAHACGAFLSDIEDRRLRHIGQDELTAAAMNADRRDLGDGGWLWSRKKSAIDISPLIAATLARWGASSDAPSAYARKEMAVL